MLSKLRKTKEIVLDILFPPICATCGAHIDDNAEKRLVCENCLAKVMLNTTLFCPVCQARLPENKRICRHEKEKFKEFPYLLGAASNFDNEILQNLIYNFKYNYLKDLAFHLGGLMINYLKSMDLKFDNFVIVPIPLYLTRERIRGYNQSELLAQIIANEFNLKVSLVLKRIKNTPPQAKEKNYENRRENMKNAFESDHAGCVFEKNIILIDDVYTSGATMGEAARLLKQNGARKIIALVLAKA